MQINKNVKIAVLAVTIGLPMLVFFQNCGKTQSFAQVEGMSALDGFPQDGSLPADLPPELANLPASGDAPLVNVAQPSANDVSQPSSQPSQPSQPSGPQQPPSNNEDSQVSINPVVPASEAEVKQAEEACADLDKLSESNNMDISKNLSEDGLSIYSIKGNHAISSKLLNGAHHLNLIDGVSGKLVVCGVDVDKIANTNGAVILVNSKVGECLNHNGNIQLIGNSSCESIVDSKVKISAAK